MSREPEELTRVITEAVREFALGPGWRETASAWPLQAEGSTIDPDHWYPVPPKIRSREGNPEITVLLSREHVATVTCSRKGKNPIIFVAPGVEVVMLDE